MSNTIYNIDIHYGINFDFSGAEREVGLDISTNRKLYQRDGSFIVPSIAGSNQAITKTFDIVNFGDLRQVICFNPQVNIGTKRAYFAGTHQTVLGNVTTLYAFFRNMGSSTVTNIPFQFTAFYTKTA